MLLLLTIQSVLFRCSIAMLNSILIFGFCSQCYKTFFCKKSRFLKKIKKLNKVCPNV